MITNHFNGLTEAELERLALIAEEASEVIQVVNKIIRHGYSSAHPNTPEVTNRKLLEREIGDFYAAVSRATTAKDLDLEVLVKHSVNKLHKKPNYLHHN